MSTNAQRPPGQPNQGTGQHSRGSSADAHVVYELSGPVRWLDTELARIVVDVRETDHHAGMLKGKDVTVDLREARVNGLQVEDLVPGTSVRVKMRLPRDPGHALPDPLPAVSVSVL